jgi:DNA-binding transcriptional regulator YiaG
MTPTQILRWRTRLGMTQADAASLIGVSGAGWRKWEAGTREIPTPVERLLRLVETLPGAREALERMES